MKIAIIVVVSVMVFLTLVGSLGVVAIKAKLGAGGNLAVRLEHPERGDLVEFISAPGEIQPIRKVEIRSKISAKITELPYKEGDRVTMGDPNSNPPRAASILVKLDDKDLQADLKASRTRRDAQEARIEIARVRLESRRERMKGERALLEQAKRDLARSEELLLSGDVKPVEVEQQRTNVANQEWQLLSSEISLDADEQELEASKLDLAATDASIAQKEEELKYTMFTSPLDGVVTKVNAEVGEMATGSLYNPGTVLLEVADLSQMMLVAQIDEADISKIRVGQRAHVYIQAWPERVFEGVVATTALAPTEGRIGERYFEAEVLLDNREQEIFSGLTADVDIEIDTHRDVLLVPRQAVLDREIDMLPPEIRDNSEEIDKNKLYAAVVFRYVDGQALVTPVRYGESDPTHTMILSGITEVDEIIVGPYKVLEALYHKQKVVDEKEMTEEELSKSRAAQEGVLREIERDNQNRNRR